MILHPLKLIKSVLWFKQYRRNVYQKKLNAVKTVDFLTSGPIYHKCQSWALDKYKSNALQNPCSFSSHATPMFININKYICFRWKRVFQKYQVGIISISHFAIDQEITVDC